jgi:16S rRNA (guanine966-N2)-methyltransferase
LRLKNFISVVLELNAERGACEGAYPTTLARTDEMARPGKGRDRRSQLRIIGGQWRGRKLNFEPEPGLRPTTDRIRETLFNWLAPHIHGARCLDLFAGSGALGLEALSRGAAHCDFVDVSAPAVKQIEGQLELLGARDRAVCHCTDAAHYLALADDSFDLVFVDPPFASALASPACARLAGSGLLRAEAMVYVETAAGEPLQTVPPGWTEHRGKVSGGVEYRLFRVA